jgi:hypothetical protein
LFTKSQKIIIISIVLLLLILLSALIGLKQADPQPDYVEIQPAEKAVLQPQRKVESFNANLQNSNSPASRNSQLVNSPPAKTIWLGPKFNNLTGVGSNEIGGYALAYVPPDYAKRILGGDGTSQPVPIIIQTRDQARKEINSLKSSIDSDFDPSSVITVKGQEIQLYAYDTVAFIPFYEIDRVAVIQSYSKKLLREAIENLIVVN